MARGVNVEEPEHYGVQQTGAGYDLRGATRLVLDVRSPSGLRVQFGVSNGLTSFMTIPPSPTFSTLSIPLNSLNPAPNLADVHLLFTVVTNDLNAIGAGALALLLGNLLLSRPRVGPWPRRALAATWAVAAAGLVWGCLIHVRLLPRCLRFAHCHSNFQTRWSSLLKTTDETAWRW